MQRLFTVPERILRFSPPSEDSAESAFSPLDLLGLWAWYDASDSNTVRNSAGSIAGSGEAVAEWRDKSGNSRSVVQATPANRPVLALAPDRQIQFSPTPNPQYLEYTPGTSLAQPNTIFLVGARDSAGQRVFLDGAAGSQHAVYTESNLWGIFSGTVRTGGTPDTTRHILRAVFNGATSALFVDGAAVLSGNAGTQGLGRVRLGFNAAGTGYALSGHLCEVILVHGILTIEQIAACEAYLESKW